MEQDMATVTAMAMATGLMQVAIMLKMKIKAFWLNYTRGSLRRINRGVRK